MNISPLMVISGNRTSDCRDDLKNYLINAGAGEVVFFPGVYAHSLSTANICMAHLSIIQSAKSKGFDVALCAEDDVQFTCDSSFQYFNSLIKELPADWDVFISGAYYYRPQKLTSPISKLDKFSSLHLYAVNSKFFDRMLQADPSFHIDNWISRYSGANVYMSYPMTAVQNAGYSENYKKQVDYSARIMDHDIYKG